MEEADLHKTALRISVITIIINLLLSLFKLTVGIAAKSFALISDAVHSASDVFSTLIVILGVKISAKQSDEKHPFGHERFECIAAILLAFVLVLTGGGIGYGGIKSIIDGSYHKPASHLTVLALFTAIISIAVKEGMYWYTRWGAKKTHSSALMADAWHHRSDALSSVGSLVAVIGVKLGKPVLDPVASIVICAFILRAAAMIFVDAARKMTDESIDPDTIKNIRETILSTPGVLGIDSLKTRQFADKSYVETEIVVDCRVTLLKAHNIAEQVHTNIEQNFALVKHCVVHVNPGAGCENNDQPPQDDAKQNLLDNGHSPSDVNEERPSSDIRHSPSDVNEERPSSDIRHSPSDVNEEQTAQGGEWAKEDRDKITKSDCN